MRRLLRHSEYLILAICGGIPFRPPRGRGHRGWRAAFRGKRSHTRDQHLRNRRGFSMAFSNGFALWCFLACNSLPRAFAALLSRNRTPRRPQRGHGLRGRHVVYPVPITRFSLTIFVPRVGLPRNLCLIGSLTAALRFSKGSVRKDLNLVMGIGCFPIDFQLHVPTELHFSAVSAKGLSLCQRICPYKSCDWNWVYPLS